MNKEENRKIRATNFKISLIRKFLVNDKKFASQTFESVFHRPLDLENPKTLNECIQWLKLYDYKKIYSVLADKYRCKDYIKEHFGDEYNIPLLFVTNKIKEINEQNINVFPCVVKANHSSGQYLIFHNKEEVNWDELRDTCKTWLKTNYYAMSGEKQYRDIKRYIIVEKLLQTKEGKIPNDYKLHFIEGNLVFTYCSIDREGDNYRQIYDNDWNVLPFCWDGKNKPQTNFNKIKQPSSYNDMVRIGKEIAKDFHYVRVDFFDVDGKLYCGEITLHHGGGFDRFNPEEYDYEYGKLVKLPIKK